jgi:hypothetical protein
MTRDGFREAIAVQAAALVSTERGRQAVDLLSFAALTESVLDLATPGPLPEVPTVAHGHDWADSTSMGADRRTYLCRICGETRSVPWGETSVVEGGV